MKLRTCVFEVVITTYRSDLQVKRSVPGMVAVVQQGFGRFMFCTDLHEVPARIGTVGFAEVATQTALSVVNL